MVRQKDRKSESRFGSRLAEVDMTPMVDVTFLLLIFFMVTASFSLQKSVAVSQEPTGASINSVEPVPQSTVDIVVDEAGAFWVRCDAWSRDVVGKQSLISSLKEIRLKQSAETKVRVSIADRAKLQSLVDVLDSISAAELSNVSIQQVSEDDLGNLPADSLTSVR